MGWFSNAALREARLFKTLLKLASFSVDGSGNITGFVDANGNAVVPIHKTLAQFLALGPTEVADGAVVRITNLHGRSGVGGVYATWDATASRWGQNFGGAWVFDTYALLIASFPLVAKWDGFTFWVNNGVGYNGAELINKTTRYRHTQKGRVLMAKNSSRDTINSNKQVEKIECQWAAPGGFIAIGDTVYTETDFSKSGATASNFMARDFHIGTTGTISDQSLLGSATASSSASNLSCDEQKKWTVTAATKVWRPGPVGAIDIFGFSTTIREVEITIPNISNDLYVSFGIWINNGAPTDTLTHEASAIYLEMGS